MRGAGSTVAMLLVLLATACSVDAERPRAAGPSPTLAAPTLAAPTLAAPTLAAPTPSASAAPGPSRAPGVVDPRETVFFTSPTGNISCFMARDSAICEIRGATFEPPEKPSDCAYDYGTMVAIEGRQRARFFCHSDTGFGTAGSVVQYGERMTNGMVTCTSRRSGMTCSSADGAHGFVLSRASYRLY